MKNPVHNLKGFVNQFGNSYFYHTHVSNWLGSGVVDCTGKEIFEGDIVEFIDVYGKRYPIEFRDACFFVGNAYLLNQFARDSSNLKIVGHIAEERENNRKAAIRIEKY